MPVELLVAVATQLAEDDELATSLACRKLREAVAATKRRAAGAQLSTRFCSALGSVDKLESAVSCGTPLGAKLLTPAARLGQLEPLCWLCALGCALEHCKRWQEGPCSSAAEGCHLAVLQWARADGCPWNELTCANAAGGGHLPVLRRARANGCPWDWLTCPKADRFRHLGVLQWARANGCPWDRRTCSAAAEGGHLSMLQWARANDCPWDEGTCMGAAKGGHLSVLLWACRCEWLPVG
jgi:hypothetical protein